MAALYAFGAMLAITIAHLSILRLRISEPDRTRPFRVPWNVSWRGAQLPVPTILAALLSALAFLSVLAFHDRARWVGGGWMLFGLLFYVVYRKVFEGTSLTRRVSVTERALTKQAPDVEYGNILVPVFGTELDDDIVATAGRLAAAEQEGDAAIEETHLAIVYVLEVPLTLPLDAELPPERENEALQAIDRAREIAEEYEDVRVSASVTRARKVGAGIVEAARRGNVEAIVVGAEPPSKIRGGATLGGIGAARPAEIGAATEYVLKKAPCQVLLTAPPEAVAAELRAERPRPIACGELQAVCSIRDVFILIVGCGRVGSSVARSMLSEGHEVSCLDEDPESHTRLEVGLDKGWEDLGGRFTVGTGLETDALVAAGIETADAFIAATNGDNTNIVIAQIAQRRYEVPNVIARILDPLRAEWYRQQGMHTICPTRVAIDMLESAVREGAQREAV